MTAVGGMPSRRRAICGALAALACRPLAGAAQARVPTVALVAAARPEGIAARAAAFRDGLKELGYVDGRTIRIEFRYANEHLDRIPELVDDLVRRNVDVIVSAGPSVTSAARRATPTIPIVMAFDTDPVGSGAVASLARPGGNVTGLSIVAIDLLGKQLELLREFVPKLSRVAVVGNAREPGNRQALQAAGEAAARLGMAIDVFDLARRADIDPVFARARAIGDEAMLVLSNPIALFDRIEIAAAAVRQRMPAIYPYPEIVEAGGLVTYGVNLNDMFRRSAAFVDRLLRGARPADMPVEQPTKFDLVIHAGAARRIGLSVPPALAARADRVID